MPLNSVMKQQPVFPMMFSRSHCRPGRTTVCRDRLLKPVNWEDSSEGVSWQYRSDSSTAQECRMCRFHSPLADAAPQLAISEGKRIPAIRCAGQRRAATYCSDTVTQTITVEVVVVATIRVAAAVVHQKVCNQ